RLTEALVSEIGWPVAPNGVVAINSPTVVADVQDAGRKDPQPLPGTPAGKIPVFGKRPRLEALLHFRHAVQDGKTDVFHPGLGKIADPQACIDHEPMVWVDGVVDGEGRG